MSLDPGNFPSDWLQQPLSSPKEDLLLPPLATIVIDSMKESDFGPQMQKYFLAPVPQQPQIALDIEIRPQQSPIQPPDPVSLCVASETAIIKQPATARVVKQSVRDFQFIQINTPSGKIDSSGGTNMRSHIRKKFHENRRRREKEKVLTLQKLACHRCGTAQPLATSVQSFRKTTNCHEMQHLPNEPCARSDMRSANTYTPPTGTSPETIRLGAVCSQCGRLSLQRTTYNEEWDINGAWSGVLHGTSSSDPFDSSAIPIDHKMHGLIHYFIYIMIVPMSPPIYQGDGFLDLMNVIQMSTSLSDEVCIRAIVAAAASHQSTIWSNRMQQRSEHIKRGIDYAVFHMSEGVRLLNKKFEDPKQALSAASLFGAALLGLCASYLGDNKLAKSTHHGMLKMIELRGGINTLPRSLAGQMIRRFRENGAQVSAVAVCSKTAAELFPRHQRYVVLKQASSPFSNHRFESFLWGELFPIACDLHRLSYMIDLNVRHPRMLGSVQREFFEDTYAAVLHSLSSFAYPNDLGLIKTVTYYRQHLWRLAAWMYLNAGIRQLDTTVAIISEFLSSLRASDLLSMWSAVPEVLLWLLFVGACVIWEETDRRWLLLEFKHGTRLLRIESLGQLEDFLKTMLYVDSMRARHLNRIWQELNS